MCDGEDNDCDNMADEDGEGNPLSQSCYTGPAGTENVGLCIDGTQTCSAGSWDDCAGEVTPGTEICDITSFDEDCDGSTNEDCACSEGDTQNCGSDAGLCEYGTQTCDSSGPVE